MVTDIQILVAPDPAPAGGVEVTVTSDNPSLIQVVTPTVTIPEGQFQTTAQVLSVSDQTGTAQVTASSPGFSADTTQVSLTASLNIIQGAMTIESGVGDDLDLELGSGGNQFPAPAGGVSVDLSSDHTDCVVVTSPEAIPEGQKFGSASLSYGGSASLPCTATVTANNAVFGSDTADVTVDDVADIGTLSFQDLHYGDNRIGGGLQVPYRVSLSGSEHGGATVRIASNNTARLLLSPAATTTGTAFIDLVFANGETYKDFYVQGVKGGTGVATLTATATGFTNGMRDVTVVQAVIAIQSLPGSIGSAAANHPFWVRTGYTNSGGGFIYAWVNPNGAIPVIVRSSNVLAAQLVSGTGSGGQITVEVPINAYESAHTLGSGGMELDPLAVGTTTISTEANSFDNSYSTSYQSVTVTP